MNSKLNRSPCNFRVEPVKNKLSLSVHKGLARMMHKQWDMPYVSSNWDEDINKVKQKILMSRFS